MNDDKNKNAGSDNNSGSSKTDEQIHVHNPFKKDDDKELTEQDLENEQAFKEAQTERD